MTTLLIGYDLNSPGQRYDDLITAIKALGSWWHYLDSTWIVQGQISASTVRDRLGQHIDAGDELLVVDVTGDNWAGKGFEPPAYDWLKDHML